MLKLTPEDKEFIKLTENGSKPSTAFREAYPEHPASAGWLESTPGTDTRQRAAEILKYAAKTKLNTKYIKNALMTYQDKMEEYSALSLDTATDLVVNARSEKVRADLAIEGIRHKIGSPTVKVQSQESRVVHITFGEPPKNPVFVESDVQDDIDDSFGIDTTPASPASYPSFEDVSNA